MNSRFGFVAIDFMVSSPAKRAFFVSLAPRFVGRLRQREYRVEERRALTLEESTRRDRFCCGHGSGMLSGGRTNDRTERQAGADELARQGHHLVGVHGGSRIDAVRSLGGCDGQLREKRSRSCRDGWRVTCLVVPNLE